MRYGKRQRARDESLRRQIQRPPLGRAGEGEVIRILQGDCLEVLKTLPDESVHCVVTSPPYWGLRDYGVAGQLGLESTPQHYVAAMVEVFASVKRVLRDDGTLWLNLGDSYAGSWGAQSRPNGNDIASTLQGGSMLSARQIAAHPKETQTGSLKHTPGLKAKDLCGIPWRVAFALQADGWWLRQDIIWAKPNPMPESVTDRCTKAHEYIFMLAKSERYYYDQAAIAEPLASASIERLSQPNLENQEGSDRVPGKTNGRMKAVSKQDATARNSNPSSQRRYEGFNARYFGSDKPYTGKATKDYASGGAQDASATKARIVEAILAGDITTRNKRSVWTVTTKPFKDAHFATFPPDLIEPCILAGCPKDGTVLDPFGGAGTTGLVADRLGRNAILIELNPEYAEMARKRITGDCPMFADVS